MSAAKPLSAEEIAVVAEQWAKTILYREVVGTAHPYPCACLSCYVPNLLATLRARDEEIARVRAGYEHDTLVQYEHIKKLKERIRALEPCQESRSGCHLWVGCECVHCGAKRGDR